MRLIKSSHCGNNAGFCEARILEFLSPEISVLKVPYLLEIKKQGFVSLLSYEPTRIELSKRSD